jgi:hypothetical protein
MNELNISVNQSNTLANMDDSTLAELKRGGGGSFLARMDVGQGLSAACQKNFVKQGAFFLNRQDPKQCIQLGSFDLNDAGDNVGQVQVVYLGWRPKAMHLHDLKMVALSHDAKSPVFRKIKEISDTKSARKGHLYYYGTECLLWIPPSQIAPNFNRDNMARRNLGETKEEANEILDELEAIANGGTFVGLFYKNTARKYSPAGEIELGAQVILETGFIQTTKASWWLCKKIIPHALTEADQPNLLTQAMVNSEMNAFNNPPSEQAEVIEEEDKPAANQVENFAR